MSEDPFAIIAPEKIYKSAREVMGERNLIAISGLGPDGRLRSDGEGVGAYFLFVFD